MSAEHGYTKTTQQRRSCFLSSSLGEKAKRESLVYELLLWKHATEMNIDGGVIDHSCLCTYAMVLPAGRQRLWCSLELRFYYTLNKRASELSCFGGTDLAWFHQSNSGPTLSSLVVLHIGR